MVSQSFFLIQKQRIVIINLIIANKFRHDNMLKLALNQIVNLNNISVVFNSFYSLSQLMIMQKSNDELHTDTPNPNIQQLKLKISHKDQVKLLKKKITILKEAVIASRKKSDEDDNQKRQLKEKLKKEEAQNKKKDQRNQALLLQIRSLKDSLIIQRNEKQKYIDQLKIKEDDEKRLTTNGASTMSASNYFGLKGLFQR